MKTCPRCGIAKPFSEYHRASRYRDGLQINCKTCHREGKHSDLLRERSMAPRNRIAALTKAHSDAQMEDQFRDASLPQSHTYAASDAFHRLLRNEAAWLIDIAEKAVAIAGICEDVRDMRMGGVDPASEQAESTRVALDRAIVALGRAVEGKP